MEFFIFLFAAFLVSFASMYLIAIKTSGAYSAYLVRAGVISTPENPPVSFFGKMLNSEKKSRVSDSSNNPVSIRFGFKQPFDDSAITSRLKSRDIAFGKAIGNSMEARGIVNGRYFVFELGDFSEAQASLGIGDIVVTKIDDKNSPDFGGLKLREIQRLVETGHYHGVTYKNGLADNEGEKRHLRSNIKGKVIMVLE
jgi:hypothetical protein